MARHRTQAVITLDPVTREFLVGQFQRQFFESAVSAEPNNLECLVQLGDIYTCQGRYEKGLEIDHRLVTLRPEEPTFRYNQACSYALLNHDEQSVEALREAIRLGYRDLEHMEKDEYLENLHGTPSFKQLLVEYFPAKNSSQ